MMKIPDYINQNRLAIAWAGAVAVVLVGMYWEAGLVFARRWLGAPADYHCMAVLALGVSMLWRALGGGGVRPASEDGGEGGAGCSSVFFWPSAPFSRGGSTCRVWGSKGCSWGSNRHANIWGI